ncbi:MAG: DUF922 domain-containing protein [Crocinitomicaceae bacterium]
MRSIFKYAFIILFGGLFLSFKNDANSLLQTQENDYIHWADRKLKWTDFRGPIPSDSKYHAMTHSMINLKFEGEGSFLTFDIETIFDPNLSWKKTGVDDHVLKHEQIHFDITEYYARVLRKELKSHHYSDINSIESEVKSMFNKSFEDAERMQKKYDEETNHSLNKKKQEKWNKKVKKYLQDTGSFKNPRIKVNISYLLRQ